MTFVIHREFGMPLEGEDVAADAEPLVTAEVAGGEGDGTFRQARHLIVVVDDKAHLPVGEPGGQVLAQNLHLADAHAPAAGEAFYTPAQRLCDDLMPEADADKGDLLPRGLPNPLLQR